MPTESYGERFCLTLLTNDARLAADGDAAGVNRIGIDLERLGKAERQAGGDSRASEHTWDDLAKMAPSVQQADLFARTNPIHSGTRFEIETALHLGVKVLMLPAFETPAEVARFVDFIQGRARVSILIETGPAVTRIRDILAVAGVDEVMIGLNDLRLQLGVVNHFEVLASPLVDMLACEARRKGLPLSIGGIARVEDVSLPVPADLVYAQYPRLGATGAWIARSFLRGLTRETTLKEAIPAARKRLGEWGSASPEALERARGDLARSAREWILDSHPNPAVRKG